MNSDWIPFNKPYMTGKELHYISQAHSNGILAGDGPFTKKCHGWLESNVGVKKALLTHSCTAALEMAAILAAIGPGDEVIMPSYTFVSTANAFVLRGGVPVFVDIRPDTLNIDERLIEEAITPRTRAIVPVHYAGVACEMDAIMEIARRHNLLVIEDAAHAVLSTYKGRKLGSIGHMGAYSFHETKNVTSGEGGVLLINDDRYVERAQVIRDKGTNRSQFFRGLVDKYTWVDLGSSFLPGELSAAFLYAQLEEAEEITSRRLTLWNQYNTKLKPLEELQKIRLPIIPFYAQHNAHMFYCICNSENVQSDLIAFLKKSNIHATFHYLPLHNSKAGRTYGRAHGEFPTTMTLSARLVRLPLWIGIEDKLQSVIHAIYDFMEKAH